MLFKYLLPLLILGLSTSAASVTLQAPAAEPTCSTCAANIIAKTYPNNVTATINGTSFVLPVPIDYARFLLPTGLASLILTHAYTRFPIPPNHYPIVLDNAFQHDIRYKGVNAVPDEPTLRLTFPFIGLLGDNSTCFRYTSYIYLENVKIAQNGTATYRINTITSTFDPPDQAFRELSPRGDKFNPHGDKFYFSVYTDASRIHQNSPAAAGLFHPTSEHNAFPLAFYRNVTNQPTFGNNSALCDQKIRFWNTTLSEGDNCPQNVLADVMLSPPLLRKAKVWNGVKGIRASQAVLENLYLPCGSLRGYGGTGEGDSG